MMACLFHKVSTAIKYCHNVDTRPTSKDSYLVFNRITFTAGVSLVVWYLNVAQCVSTPAHKTVATVLEVDKSLLSGSFVLSDDKI